MLKRKNISRVQGDAKCIHRQQLFHWIGGNLDKRNKGRKVVADDLVPKYLDYVRGSLEHGLWVKIPSIPEEFALKKDLLPLTKPIICFTEWSLGQTVHHTGKYGRIGFGFPKRWVIERGGQSVTYFRHAERSPFLQSIFRLLRATPTSSPVFDDLLYVLHFAKMIRERRQPSAVKKRKVPKPLITKHPTLKAQPAATFRRRFGAQLPFVEEREWRIVHHADNSHFVKGPGLPEYYLPYIPGDELFTLVLPDNKVVSRVLQTTWFTKRLFTPHLVYPKLKRQPVPPVTVLAYSDIQTF